MSVDVKSWGQPTDELAEALSELPFTVKIGILRASAVGELRDPDALIKAIEPMLAEVKRLASVARMHLLGAVARAEQRGNAYERALERAEKQVGTALHGLQVFALAEAGFDPRGFFVYCLWGDQTDCPLYVGQSTNVLARLGSHVGDTRKRPSIRRVTLIRCKTARQMDATEMRLIRTYQPPWNTAGITGRPPVDLEVSADG